MNYQAVITIQVEIPEEIIETDDGAFLQYLSVEERMVADAEWQLQSIITDMRASHRG